MDFSSAEVMVGMNVMMVVMLVKTWNCKNLQMASLTQGDLSLESNESKSLGLQVDIFKGG